MKKFTLSTSLLALVLPALLSACGNEQDSSDLSGVSRGVVVRSVAAWNAAGIQAYVDAFRRDLGGENNGVAEGSQTNGGRREINWDGVPAAISSPNHFPGATFQNRGLLISSPGVKLQVSTKQDEAAQAAPLFGNLNANFPKIFAAFSPEKLFAPVQSTITDMTFVVAGTDKVAAVSGFGAVFTDVDLKGISKIEYYNSKGQLLHSEWVKALWGKNKSLSFVGVTFKDGRKVSKVRIYSGNIKLGGWKAEDKWNDAVAMDDFIYGEPKEVKSNQHW